MSSQKLIALGQKYERKYAQKAVSPHDDKNWQKCFDAVQKMLDGAMELDHALRNDANVDFKDVRDNRLTPLRSEIISIAHEITFRISNLYGSVDSDVYPDLDLHKEHELYRK